MDEVYTWTGPKAVLDMLKRKAAALDRLFTKEWDLIAPDEHHPEWLVMGNPKNGWYMRTLGPTPWEAIEAALVVEKEMNHEPDES